jgi:hypothetical protein
LASLIREAVPPMWKVRIVNCVPGSPMDCAAMTPDRFADVHLLPGRQVATVAEMQAGRAAIRRSALSECERRIMPAF